MESMDPFRIWETKDSAPSTVNIDMLKAACTLCLRATM